MMNPTRGRLVVQPIDRTTEYKGAIQLVREDNHHKSLLRAARVEQVGPGVSLQPGDIAVVHVDAQDWAWDGDKERQMTKELDVFAVETGPGPCPLTPLWDLVAISEFATKPEKVGLLWTAPTQGQEKASIGMGYVVGLGGGRVYSDGAIRPADIASIGQKVWFKIDRAQRITWHTDGKEYLFVRALDIVATESDEPAVPVVSLRAA